MISYILSQTEDKCYKAYFARTNEKITTIRAQILGDISFKKNIEFEGLYRTIEAKNALKLYKGEEFLKTIPITANYLFIVSEIKSINMTPVKKEQNLLVPFWTEEELELLYQGSIYEVAAVLKRTPKAVEHRRYLVKTKKPELHERLIANASPKAFITLEDEQKEKLTNNIENLENSNKRAKYQFFTPEEEKLMIIYENEGKSNKEIAKKLNKPIKTITSKLYNMKKNKNGVYNKLKEETRNLKSVSDLKEEMTTRLEQQIKSEEKIISQNEQASKTINEVQSIKTENSFEFTYNGTKLVFKNTPNAIKFEKDGGLIIE